MDTLHRIEDAAASDRPSPAAEVRTAGTWPVYPLEGALELHYRDVAGNRSRRRVLARELKIGPGKTLLGGIDTAADGYRGFRADRIHSLIDAESGRTVDRNILDWLIARAVRHEKDRRRAAERRA